MTYKRDSFRGPVTPDPLDLVCRWEPLSRADACLLWDHEPILVVAPGSSRPHALVFEPGSGYFRGAGPFRHGALRYYRRAGMAAMAADATPRRAVGRAALTAALGGAAPATPAEPKPKAEPKPAPKKETICKLTAIAVVCGHKRKPSKGVIEIVPDKGGEKMKLSSTFQGGCGKHPEWQVSGAISKKSTGTEMTLAIDHWKVGLTSGGAIGARKAAPKVYTVNAISCQGTTERVEIRAFPSDQVEISISNESVSVSTSPDDWSLTIKKDIVKALDRMRKINYVLDKLLKPWVEDRFQWECLKNITGKYAAKWVEHKDHRAFYQYEASIALDPLLKASFTIPFGPTAAIPPRIKKWTTDLIGDFYLYIKFEGEIALGGKWSKKDPDTAGATGYGKGKLGLKVGGNLFLAKKQVLNIDVCGATWISIKGETAKGDSGPALDWVFMFGTPDDPGLYAEVTIEAAWGTVEYKHRFKILDSKVLDEGRWEPFAKSA